MNKTCPICGSARFAALARIEGYRQSVFYEILECADCTVSYADPLLSDEKLYESIYENVENVPGYSRYFALAQAVRDATDPLSLIEHREEPYFGVIQYLRNDFAAERGLVLEVGCGQGYLTYSLVRAGYRALGIDISKKVIDRAKANFGDYFYCGSLEQFVQQQPHDRPSHIVCTELIEHLENPLDFVRTTLDLMSDGGKLIITTPNKLDVNESVWDTDLPPVHLWWFNRKSLSILAKSVNADIEFVSLDSFFKLHDVRRDTVISAGSVRRPTFDENYRLIRPQAEKSAFRKKLRATEKFLKAVVSGRNAPSSGASTVCDDAHSKTICAVLRKRS